MTRPLVLLAPSYGNPKTKKRYSDTIEGSIDFRAPEYRSLLTPEQLSGLNEHHRSGSAHFWGAIATHNRMMDRLGSGDVVVFTGEKKVRAAGEIGFLFRNTSFADRLWDQYDEENSFVNVYTVVNVRPIDRPITDLWQLDGFNQGDFVYRQRLLQDVRADLVLDAFDVRSSLAEAALDAELDDLSHALGGSRITPVESMNTDVIWQQVTARNAEYDRVEGLLVRRYRESHPSDEFRAFRTPVGHRADLYLETGDEAEIIEAKSLSRHEKVREAVAQLLDYAPHSPRPVTRLTALFPDRPSDHSVAYLHRLGIDCVHRTPDGRFVREEAEADCRRRLLAVWRGSPA